MAMLSPISVRYFNIKMSEVFRRCLKNTTNRKEKSKARVFLVASSDLLAIGLVLRHGLLSWSFRKASKGRRYLEEPLSPQRLCVVVRTVAAVRVLVQNPKCCTRGCSSRVPAALLLHAALVRVHGQKTTCGKPNLADLTVSEAPLFTCCISTIWGGEKPRTN